MKNQVRLVPRLRPGNALSWRLCLPRRNGSNDASAGRACNSIGFQAGAWKPDSGVQREVFFLLSLFFYVLTGIAIAVDRPNVMIVLADDLGFGGLSCFGQTEYTTPQLDRMAAEGARLTHFNCPASFCAQRIASSNR